jgi:hypothetical protein
LLLVRSQSPAARRLARIVSKRSRHLRLMVSVAPRVSSAYFMHTSLPTPMTLAARPRRCRHRLPEPPSEPKRCGSFAVKPPHSGPSPPVRFFRPPPCPVNGPSPLDALHAHRPPPRGLSHRRCLGDHAGCAPGRTDRLGPTWATSLLGLSRHGWLLLALGCR